MSHCTGLKRYNVSESSELLDSRKTSVCSDLFQASKLPQGFRVIEIRLHPGPKLSKVDAESGSDDLRKLERLRAEASERPPCLSIPLGPKYTEYISLRLHVPIWYILRP